MRIVCSSNTNVICRSACTRRQNQTMEQLSTEELLHKLEESGINVTEEAQICTLVKGYNGFTLEGTAPVTSCCTPTGTHFAHYF